LELFDTTKKISVKSKRYVELNTHKSAVTGVHPNGDLSVQSLYKKMRQLSIERLSQLPISDKVEWTIYKKNTLIGYLKTSRNGLELFQKYPRTLRKNSLSFVSSRSLKLNQRLCLSC
jgi:hypothetical protein